MPSHNSAPKPSPKWDDLIASYLDETILDSEFSELKDILTNQPDARSRYLDLVKNDVLLREIAGSQRVASKRRRRLPLVLLLAGSCGAILLLAVLSEHFSVSGSVAELGLTSDDVRWLSEPRVIGSRLKKGTRLQLASGSVEIKYLSGALTRIHGPALFEIATQNSGFLHYGEVFSRARNKKSHGFSILTHAGHFVDQGTEFLTTASLDGYSQLHVTSGEVDAAVPGFELQTVRTGSGLGIETGEVPVLIRIEQGDETAAFRFPTIPPPGNSDYADKSRGQARASWLPTDLADKRNHPSPDSGPPQRLIDGRGQSEEDLPEESLFFRDGANGLIELDLGKEVSISRIHTYSWHRSRHDPDMRRRAVQRYTLWGCGDEKPGNPPNATGGTGWTRIARVNTDAFFRVEEEPDRPPQQACAIFAANAPIGKFRYLLFEVAPTPMPAEMRPRHTFFGEIDVFAK